MYQKYSNWYGVQGTWYQYQYSTSHAGSKVDSLDQSVVLLSLLLQQNKYKKILFNENDHDINNNDNWEL